MELNMEHVYDHFGVPVSEKREGMIYFPEYKVWCSSYEDHPYRIEWIYFEKGAPFAPLIQTTPHVCFIVKDIHKATHGKKILFKPTFCEGYCMAFIEEDGVPIEFMQLLK